jgi:TPR repeat protein
MSRNLAKDIAEGGRGRFRQRAKSSKDWKGAGEALFIATCYAEGIEGVGQDTEEAAIWYRRASIAGSSEAHVHLGAAYGAGNGVIQSWKTAVEWFGKSAAQENASAQYVLATCYSSGKGVTKDESKALALYRLAAAHHDSGNPEAYASVCCAQNALGDCYNHSTHGVTRNNIHAMEVYLEAAESNSGPALMNCFEHYLNGTCGFQRDFILAIKYLRDAAVQEHGNALHLIQNIVCESRVCMACGKPKATRKCARCCKYRYCNASCQMVAWKHPIASHKLRCQGAHSPRGNQDASPFTSRACSSGANLESTFMAE